jgi:SAM-dependent methyltransferase
LKQKIEHIPYVFPDRIAELESESTFAVIMEAIDKYLKPGARILDIGCGRGELMDLLSRKGYEVCGCDIDDECLRLSGRYGKVYKLNVNEIHAGTFDEKFDCVLMSHVLEHLDNPREALTRLAKVTRGLMIISVPNPHCSSYVTRSLARRKIKYVNTGHLYSWDWHHLKTFVEVACGLKVLEFFHDSVPMPVPYRLRLYLYEKGIMHPLEDKALKWAFPMFCRSITAAISTDAAAGEQG